MTPAQRARVRELFQGLCDKAPDQRQQLLDLHSQDDAAVRAYVAALLEIDGGSDSQDAFLESPPLVAAPDFPMLTKAAVLSDGAVRYRIVRLIGQGGMGVVYEARQEVPARRVALKLMRQMLPSAAVEARFLRECELLGRLNHPGIASVYEAGRGKFLLDDEQAVQSPFLAMEYVEGTMLLEHCELAQLTIPARLELIAKVCDAVQHAHQMGVVHRDLKPSNILVTAAGDPKVLDFGVARALDEGAFGEPLTRSGQPIGTPAYMSPEQIRGDWRALDTRTDIYALGVILYELLSGRLPVELHDASFLEAARRVAEVEPAPLGRIAKSFRGDLEAIAAKALAKDRARRYASAAEMADDIRRHLRDEPIRARLPTAAYLATRFVRRHRLAIVSVSLALAGAFGGLSYGLLEARSQRDAARAAEERATAAAEGERSARKAAERQARIAAGVNQFLNDDLLAAVNPDNTPNRDLLMRDVLDAAGRKIEGRFLDEPLVEAATRATLGLTYMRLGDYAAAEKHLTRAVELRRANLDPTDPELFETVGTLVNLLYNQGWLAEAEQLLVEQLALGQQAFGEASELVASTMGSLGFLRMRMGRLTEAEPLMLEATRDMRRLKPNSPDTIRLLINLASLYGRSGRTDEAVTTLRETVDLARANIGKDHPETLSALGVLAAIHNQRAEYSISVPLLMEVMEAQARVLGAEHPQTLFTRSNLGFAYLHNARLAEAAELLESVLNTRVRLLGEAHPHTLESLFLVAELRRKQGRLPEAESALRQGIELKNAAAGDTPPARVAWISVLADVLDAQGKAEAARSWRKQIAE